MTVTITAPATIVTTELRTILHDAVRLVADQAMLSISQRGLLTIALLRSMRKGETTPLPEVIAALPRAVQSIEWRNPRDADDLVAYLDIELSAAAEVREADILDARVHAAIAADSEVLAIAGARLRELDAEREILLAEMKSARSRIGPPPGTFAAKRPEAARRPTWGNLQFG